MSTVRSLASGFLPLFFSRLKFLTQVPAVPAASLRCCRCCCCCCCTATLSSGVCGSHQSAGASWTGFSPVSEAGGWEENGLGKGREGIVVTPPCPSPVAFIFHVAPMTTTATMQWGVWCRREPTIHRRAPRFVARRQLISRCHLDIMSVC